MYRTSICFTVNIVYLGKKMDHDPENVSCFCAYTQYILNLSKNNLDIFNKNFTYIIFLSPSQFFIRS